MASPCFAVRVPAHAVGIEPPPASTLAHRLAVMCLAQARWPEGCCSSASLNHACRLTDSRRVYPRPAIAQEALHRTGRLSSASSQLDPTPGQRCSSPWLRRCTAKAPQGHVGRAGRHNKFTILQGNFLSSPSSADVDSPASHPRLCHPVPEPQA